MTSFDQSVFRRRERGAVLVVSLLLLLVMTALAISISQSTRLQERVAGNIRDVEVGNWSSDSALRDAENLLLATNGQPSYCDVIGTCMVMTQGYFATTDVAAQPDSWWSTNGTEFGTTGHDLDSAVSDPKYVIEMIGKDEGHAGLTVGQGTSKSRIYYQISARSHGKTNSTVAVSQSVYSMDTG